MDGVPIRSAGLLSSLASRLLAGRTGRVGRPSGQAVTESQERGVETYSGASIRSPKPARSDAASPISSTLSGT